MSIITAKMKLLYEILNVEMDENIHKTLALYQNVVNYLHRFLSFKAAS